MSTKTKAKVEPKTEPKNGPVRNAKIGPIRLTVWENVRDVKGEERVFPAFTLERRYKDEKDDTFKSTNSLRKQDLGPAIALLQDAQRGLIEGE